MKIDNAILSCNSNRDYIDFWPIVAKAWRKIGIKPILFYVTHEKEEDLVNLTNEEVIRINVPDSIDTRFAGQFARMICSGMFNEKICIVSDIDNLPLSTYYFNDNIEHINEDNFVIFRDGVADENQISMMWNAAKGKIWSELFKIEDEIITNQIIVEKIKEYYPNDYIIADESYNKTGIVHQSWYTDQIVLFDIVKNFEIKYPNKVTRLTDEITNFNRLDKVKSNNKYHTFVMDYNPIMNDYSDFHMPRPFIKYESLINEIFNINFDKNKQYINKSLLQINNFFFTINDLIDKKFKDKKIKFLPTKTDYFDNALRIIENDIEYNYILMSGNSDININRIFINSRNFPKNLKIFFGQNIDLCESDINNLHFKILPIPIGLENTYDCYVNNIKHGSKINHAYKKVRQIEIFNKNKTKLEFEPKYDFLFNFSLDTNVKKRKDCLDASLLLEKERTIIDITDSHSLINKKEYYKFKDQVLNSKLIICPEGNGLDTHRVWESLYFNRIPVVKKSYTYDFFKKLGVPIIVVEDWKEIEILEEEYKKMISLFHKNNILSMTWWENILENAIKGEIKNET